MINTAKSTIATFVGALCISLAPVPAKSINSQVAPGFQLKKAATRTTQGGVVYLPMEEAAAILREDAEVLRGVLNKMVLMREEKGGGLLYPARFRAQMIRSVREQVQFIFELKSAIKIALQDAGPESTQRKNLIDFGKAVAGVEFALQDVLSAYEQSKPPQKTLSTSGLFADNDVKRMIEGEHNRLGIAPPVWGR